MIAPKEYGEGYDAWLATLGNARNPYAPGTVDHALWYEGYNTAEQDEIDKDNE